MLLGFPDSLWEPADGFAPVLARLRAGAAVSLGLFRLTEGLERSDVVTVGRRGVSRGAGASASASTVFRMYSELSKRSRIS